MDTEQQLAASAHSGDREAFGKLYDLYIRRIYGFIYSKTHHKETAEDLTSLAFFKALEKIDTFDPQKPFAPWMYRIARNVVFDHYRTHHPTSDIEDVWDLPDGEDPAQDADTKLSMKEAKKHMQALSPLQREIVTLRLWEELPYREIAEIVGKNENNCKVIFSRTISQLREAMPLAAFILFINASHTI